MYYTTLMNLNLNTEENAHIALTILKDRLNKGFSVDSLYRNCPSANMAASLFIKGTSITLPDYSGFYTPLDSEEVFYELLRHLADALHADFQLDVYNESDYDEGHFDANCKEGILNITYTYYPLGFLDYFRCENCDQEIVSFSDYEKGKTYICPECGEEIDLSDAYEEFAPCITTSTYKAF